MPIESTRMNHPADPQPMSRRLTPELPGCSCGRYAAPALTRRDALRRFAGGFGALALAALSPASLRAGARSYDLMPKQPYRTPRAKRAIMLYMGGGPSQMDLLD